MSRRLIGILVLLLAVGGLALGGVFMWRSRGTVTPTTVGPPPSKRAGSGSKGFGT